MPITTPNALICIRASLEPISGRVDQIGGIARCRWDRMLITQRESLRGTPRLGSAMDSMDASTRFGWIDVATRRRARPRQ